MQRPPAAVHFASTAPFDGGALERRLRRLYGDAAPSLRAELEARADLHRRAPRAAPLDERDIVLIAYADHLQGNQRPLEQLRSFMEDQLAGAVTDVHVLPFHPATSDGGFAVADFTTIDPALGTWEDLGHLAEGRRLMVDCVINHVSAAHPWFQSFLAGDPRFARFFITRGTDDDHRGVVRPRTSPLFTTFPSAHGPVDVWTTFSADQVDLDFHEPAVLLAVVDVLLRYLDHGATVFRFDAIAYAWKEPGTSCIHLPQVHDLVAVLRQVLVAADPSALVITETNVPHDDNVTYFGDGHDEAHLVYNFALPPLLLHALHTGDASVLTRWAQELRTPSHETAFLNFTASHDGIGVFPVAGLLSQAEIAAMCNRAIEHGGRISYRRTLDGAKPYEINATYFDAVSSPEMPLDLAIDRFMVTQAVALALAGVPAVYLPSLFGAATWTEGVARSHHLRDGNRQRFEVPELQRQLLDPWSRAAKVCSRYLALLHARQRSAAFHPTATQEVLEWSNKAFVVQRTAADGTRVVAVHNVSGRNLDLPAPLAGTDLLDQSPCRIERVLPYEVRWVQLDPSSASGPEPTPRHW